MNYMTADREANNPSSPYYTGKIKCYDCMCELGDDEVNNDFGFNLCCDCAEKRELESKTKNLN